MKKFRFILALILVLTMVLSTPLMALAKSWDVTDSAGVENAFATDTDDEVIINMQNDIVMENSVVGSPISCGVVVNHQIELTAEEKEQARQEAIKAYQAEQMRIMQNLRSRRCASVSRRR